MPGAPTVPLFMKLTNKSMSKIKLKKKETKTDEYQKERDLPLVIAVLLKWHVDEFKKLRKKDKIRHFKDVMQGCLENATEDSLLEVFAELFGPNQAKVLVICRELTERQEPVTPKEWKQFEEQMVERN